MFNEAVVAACLFIVYVFVCAFCKHARHMNFRVVCIQYTSNGGITCTIHVLIPLVSEYMYPCIL